MDLTERVDGFLARYESASIAEATANKVDGFLAHYASDNYDPVKAREYYLRTRELKGRHSTKGMSETQQQAWSYAKNQISTKQKAELETEQASFKARMDELRNKATETRDRIRGKLEAFLASIEVKRPERIEPEHIEPPEFLPIPDNLSPKRKAYLQKQNSLRYGKYSREVDKAEKVASDANRAAMETYNTARQAAAESSTKAREEAKGERERVGTELKSAVANARTAYVEAKKQLVAKYEATKDAEYENIKTKLPGAEPKAKKAKAAPKAKAAKKQAEVKSTPKAQVTTSAKAAPAPTPAPAPQPAPRATGGRQQRVEM